MTALDKLESIELKQGDKVVGRNGRVSRDGIRLTLSSDMSSVKEFLHARSIQLMTVTGLTVDEAKEAFDELAKYHSTKAILKGQVNFATRKQREVLKFLNQNLY